MNNNESGPESDERRLGGIFLIVGWVIAIGLVGLLVNKVMLSPKPPTIQQTHAGTEITLYRDLDSHFRIAGSINGVPVVFLIDTGATSLAVSDELADNAKLERKATVETETANGNAIGFLTKIDELSFGGIVLHNVTAVIVKNLTADQALLGMNVLKNFNMQQDSAALHLTIPQ